MSLMDLPPIESDWLHAFLDNVDAWDWMCDTMSNPVMTPRKLARKCAFFGIAVEPESWDEAVSEVVAFRRSLMARQGNSSGRPRMMVVDD